MSEPLRVIPLEYATGDRQPRRWRTILWIALPLSWLCCAMAWLFILAVDVESVLVTGPIIFSLGAVLLVGGILQRCAWVAIVGAGHCGICILFAGLVNLLNWSPNRAFWPFAVMGLAYCGVTMVPTIVAMVHLRRGTLTSRSLDRTTTTPCGSAVAAPSDRTVNTTATPASSGSDDVAARP